MKPAIRTPRNARPPRTPPTIGPTLEGDEALPVAAAEEVGEGPPPENNRTQYGSECQIMYSPGLPAWVAPEVLVGVDAEVVKANVESAVADAVRVRASEETTPTSRLFAGYRR